MPVRKKGSLAPLPTNQAKRVWGRTKPIDWEAAFIDGRDL